MIFQQKNLEKVYFIFKLTCRAMVRPASSDKWKAPLISQLFQDPDYYRSGPENRTRDLPLFSYVL